MARWTDDRRGLILDGHSYKGKEIRLMKLSERLAAEEKYNCDLLNKGYLREIIILELALELACVKMHLYSPVSAKRSSTLPEYWINAAKEKMRKEKNE